MVKSDRHLWLVAGLLVLSLLAVIVYKTWPLINPEVSAVAALDPTCDLRAGSCTATFPDGGEISFSIEPKSIPLVQPLQLGVSVKGISASSVEVDFVGIGMTMGFNRSKLKEDADNSFSGSGVLPVCIRKAMEWEAKVLVQTEQGLVAAPFRFITVKSGVPAPGQQ